MGMGDIGAEDMETEGTDTDMVVEGTVVEVEGTVVEDMVVEGTVVEVEGTVVEDAGKKATWKRRPQRTCPGGPAAMKQLARYWNKDSADG